MIGSVATMVAAIRILSGVTVTPAFALDIA